MDHGAYDHCQNEKKCDILSYANREIHRLKLLQIASDLIFSAYTQQMDHGAYDKSSHY